MLITGPQSEKQSYYQANFASNSYLNLDPVCTNLDQPTMLDLVKSLAKSMWTTSIALPTSVLLESKTICCHPLFPPDNPIIDTNIFSPSP